MNGACLDEKMSTNGAESDKLCLLHFRSWGSIICHEDIYVFNGRIKKKVKRDIKRKEKRDKFLYTQIFSESIHPRHLA